MRIPGFRAEASLDNCQAVTYGGRSGGVVVVRQTITPSGPPHFHCLGCYWDQFDECVQDCYPPHCLIGDPECVIQQDCQRSQCAPKCGRCLARDALGKPFQYCIGGQYGSGTWVSCAGQKNR